MSLPTNGRRRLHGGSGVTRIMYRDVAEWFPKGLNSAGSGTHPSSSIADVTAGRTLALAYIQYQTPTNRPFLIHGLTSQGKNTNPGGAPTANMLSPRVKFQFLGAHPVYRGPYNVLDSSWTPQVFGATTWLTATASSATQTVASTTGFVAGDSIRFIHPTMADVVATVLSVTNATTIVLTGSVNTAGCVTVCKFHPLDADSPSSTTTPNMVYMFTMPYRVDTPPTDGRMFLCYMVEHASTHANYQEVAMDVSTAPTDLIRFAYNGGGTYISNGEALWSGTSLGTDIATATFPVDPQSGANFTAGGAGSGWHNTNFGIMWSEIP